MRICHVSGEFYDTRSGGIGTQVYMLTQKLAALGHEVDVVAYYSGTPKYSEEVRFKVYRTPLSGLAVWKHFKWGKDASALVNRLYRESRYDVVHVHMDTAMGYPIFHGIDVPMVSTFHLMFTESVRNARGLQKLLGRLRLRNILICAEKSEKVIVVNEPLIEELAKLGVKREKMVFIPNSVDTSFFSINKNPETRKKYKIAHDDVMILFVGRLDHQKGLEYLVKAAKALDRRFKVFIVGSGEGEYKRRLLNMAEGSENIIFTGPLFDDDLKEIYASSDIFVLPSLFEGMPTVLLEAMASGLPIIASDIPSVAPLVKPEFGALVKPKDSAGLSQAITRLGTSEDLHEMGRKAREEAGRYDLNRTVKDIINIYEEVVRA